MKNKKTIIVSIIVLLISVVGIFSYNSFLKEKTVEGSKKINVTVNNEATNYSKEHIFTTDKGTLGDALDEQGLIKYDKSQGGRFIHTVDNIKADSEKQQWWNITVNGENAQVGVDDIVIKDGDKFELILKNGW